MLVKFRGVRLDGNGYAYGDLSQSTTDAKSD